ncbi:multicilin [Latimeria chalumnae]|uniref:multicilin n=1 Tax=Latimeria chalumnae TaxID=7897 RepID=UPI0003C1952C|nr:PREDICTED: multicilin [Latimeria chalumnae]|eukprot:XP_005998509.1 PREDICTED: multicilin [Latimeria chalumnae]
MAMQTCYMQFPPWGYDFQFPRLQDEPEFSLQDFRDAMDTFISDPSSLMQPEMGAVDLPLSHCDVSDFGTCMPASAHTQQDQLLQGNPNHIPPPEQYWKDVADQNQRALGDALQQNNQLHVTLTRKQKEIASLQERNVKLKEVANQAKHLASVLEKLMNQQSEDNNEVVAEHFTPRTVGKRKRLEDFYDGSQNCKEVDEILKEISERCSAALQTFGDADYKRAKMEPGQSNHAEVKETINMHGVFHGLQTSTSCSSVSISSSEVDDGMSFKTSIRDHCTIRTLAFPQGNAFTTRVPSGGYKFRWVPS